MQVKWSEALKVFASSEEDEGDVARAAMSRRKRVAKSQNNPKKKTFLIDCSSLSDATRK